VLHRHGHARFTEALLPMTLRQFALMLTRFLASGAATTLCAYAVFMIAASFMHYAAASLLAWLVTIPVGFALNRKFTFRIHTPDRRNIHLLKFSAGALFQLALNEACLLLFIEHLHLSKTAAFVLTLGITASTNFAYLGLFAFRRR
jgi:putative flippase GtrA